MGSGFANQNLELLSQLLLSDNNYKAVDVFMNHYFSYHKSEANTKAKELFEFCSDKFPRGLASRLCNIYLCSDYEPQVRTLSVSLLSTFLDTLDDNDGLSPEIIEDLKPLLLSCLRHQEILEKDFRYLSDIVSQICVHVFGSPDGRWDELRDYIVAKIDLDFMNAFRLYHRLPPVLANDFLKNLSENLFSAILEKLNHSRLVFEGWDLAFKAGFKFGVHMTESPRNDRSNNMLRELARSAGEIVKKGNKADLKGTLQDLATLVEYEADKYCPKQSAFVSELLRMIGEIEGVGEDVKEVARNISQVIKAGKKVAKNISDGIEEKRTD